MLFPAELSVFLVHSKFLKNNPLLFIFTLKHLQSFCKIVIVFRVIILIFSFLLNLVKLCLIIVHSLMVIKIMSLVKLCFSYWWRLEMMLLFHLTFINNTESQTSWALFAKVIPLFRALILDFVLVSLSFCLEIYALQFFMFFHCTGFCLLFNLVIASINVPCQFSSARWTRIAHGYVLRTRFDLFCTLISCNPSWIGKAIRRSLSRWFFILLVDLHQSSIKRFVNFWSLITALWLVSCNFSWSWTIAPPRRTYSSSLSYHSCCVHISLSIPLNWVRRFSSAPLWTSFWLNSKTHIYF